ncbi:hypothetical protein L1F30_10955 [Simiduia sp. 21SJ11W-1]|uniref:protein phosphatase 1 regulatory subunit 42 n=1 Tax=Simiduia sp. 21SJ11W-1 TaxID=2909669 RepID=UPI00209CCC8E|nr:protein phosphatase 1 regulatory subunit 42 [Simiduia sp. 21SJ11W-1]UTA46680.1 hypothetical protein L1F30_10955 [Simiduia sp. 21SJ11W-1]
MLNLNPALQLAITACFSAALLIGCQGYEVSVNERKVYTPAPLFTDFNLPDRNLQRCLDQTIADQKATAAVQVKTLNCSNAGIASLAGLEVFTGLESINLADNRLGQTPELLQLMKLTYVDVRGNPALQCAEVMQLPDEITRKLPEHCR